MTQLKSLGAYLSRIMRKPAFCICENKGANHEKPAFCICEKQSLDELCSNRAANPCLCIRYIDSRIPLTS